MSTSRPSSRWLWFMGRIGFVLIALWVAVMEPWDVNGDGLITIREALLFVVRFLAFPLHLLLSITPASLLQALGLPNAYWPSSALLAIVVSLPLWGVALIGGLVLEAWLERVSSAGWAQETPTNITGWPGTPPQ